jgi:hypothetical protein
MWSAENRAAFTAGGQPQSAVGLSWPGQSLKKDNQKEG